MDKRACKAYGCVGERGHRKNSVVAPKSATTASKDSRASWEGWLRGILAKPRKLDEMGGTKAVGH